MGTLYFSNDQQKQQQEKPIMVEATELVDEFEGITEKNKELLLSLPRIQGWRTPHLYLFQRFWCQPKEIQATIAAQNHFEARASDVVVATVPKSGTTWLKALVYTIVNRGKFDIHSKSHPLLNFNSHDLVPFLEYKVYADGQIPDLSVLAAPRLFATHVPFHSLPKSVINTAPDCKIVYICRNPLDTFVSIWHFMKKIRPSSFGPLSMEEAFDMYCKGEVGFGPYWDHMLGYWEESLKSPQKVMFLKYEDLKGDVHLQVRKLAEFLGYPISPQEEKDGVAEEIAKFCSFQNLKDLEVNKKGKSILNFENNGLFRKGEVGDWVNLLSKEMVERLSNIMEEKLPGFWIAPK